jgi:subtilisin family serine protease
MRKLVAIIVGILLSQFTLWAGSDRIIIELSPLTPPASIAAAIGGKIERSIPGTNFYLIKVPSGTALGQGSQPGVIGAQLDNTVSIHPTASFLILKVPATKPAEWYAQQPAMKLVNADKANAISKGRSIVIADINARVDVGHPALIGHLTGGFDFVAARSTDGITLDQSNASFLDQSNAGFLDQSNASFLDSSTAGFLDQSNASFLDQSNASFLDQSNPAHGHGTFCAALLAAMAPDAMIMPLRAFDDNGNADAFTIALAIRYAVQNGANVINMSFGMDAEYKVVKDAIQFATSHGVDVVASAGNENGNIQQYPAAFPNVLGIAATDLTDKKASFSNYGRDVFADAPGVNIISAYPGGYYAIASGTSFSAPFVSAEAALIRAVSTKDADKPIAKGAVDIDSLNPGYKNQLGSGRIDMLQSLQSVK